MNYDKIYKNLIATRKELIRDEYTENHHIIPKSWGGSNNKENIIKLTAREHWVAHLLLVKIATGQNKYKATQAVLNMGRVISKDKRKTSCLYEKARKEIAKYISKKHTGKLVVRCQTTKKMIGMVDKNHPKILSGEWAHHMKGRTLSPERAALCASPGEKNGRYSGITDEEIINYGLEIFEKIKEISALNDLRIYVEEKYNKKVPKHFSKFRFADKSFYAIMEEKTNTNYNSYKRGINLKNYKEKIQRLLND
jgi:hypothetical protein